LRQTVLSLGTYIFGQAATMDGARLLADAMFLRDPFWVKYWRPVYGRLYSRSPLDVIAYEPEFMPLEEQTELFPNRIRKLHQYQFLLRPAASEGTISTDVFPINIGTVTQDPLTGTLHFPDRELIGELRSLLAAKSGRPIKELLQEQETSLARYTTVVDGRLRRLPPMGARPHHHGAPVASGTKPASSVAAQATSDVAPATSTTGTHGRPVHRRVRIS
jgi:hypothetical protein